MRNSSQPPWRSNSSSLASGKPGAVHLGLLPHHRITAITLSARSGRGAGARGREGSCRPPAPQPSCPSPSTGICCGTSAGSSSPTTARTHTPCKSRLAHENIQHTMRYTELTPRRGYHPRQTQATSTTLPSSRRTIMNEAVAAGRTADLDGGQRGDDKPAHRGESRLRRRSRIG